MIKILNFVLFVSFVVEASFTVDSQEPMFGTVLNGLNCSAASFKTFKSFKPFQSLK